MLKTDLHERPTSVRWIIFALACGASFLLYLHRYTWNTIAGELNDAPYNLSKTQTGFLLSLFYYTYALLQIPSGVVIDRFGPRWFLTFSILLWSLALAMLAVIFLRVTPTTSSGGDLTLLLILAGGARLLFGAAQAGCYPALTRISRVWFAPQGRTALQGLIASTAGRSGAAMSSIVLSTLLMGWLGLNWQMGLIWVSLLGLGFGVVFWWAVADSPADDPRTNEAERLLIHGGEIPKTLDVAAPTMLPWRNAFRSTSMRWFVCQQFFDAGSDVAFVGLISLYFSQARGLDLGNTGWLTSLPLIGGALGGYCGGLLNERFIGWSGNRRWSRSLIGFTGKVIGCSMLLLVARQETAAAAGGMLLLAKFFGDWSQPTVWGTCTDLGGRFSATVFSIINTSGTLGGVVMPLAFGSLLDWFTREAQTGATITKVTNWDPLFYLLAGMYLASGLCWLMVDCTKALESDVKSTDAA
jgi:ACS family glucarate transporter-like MFS transporter